jgi:hypothetical protein
VVLVANGLYDGYRPGGREWSTSAEGSGWLAYLFAAVIGAITARAVHGGAIPLRALIAVAIILFFERSVGPFYLRGQDPISLALHGFAGFASLALALATAGAIRNARALARSTVPTLEAA